MFVEPLDINNGRKYSKEELQPMFGALDKFIEMHQTLNETVLTRIFCA